MLFDFCKFIIFFWGVSFDVKTSGYIQVISVTLADTVPAVSVCFCGLGAAIIIIALCCSFTWQH